MAKVDTLPEILRPLMLAPSITTPVCAICGRPAPLNQHHVVRRGAGKLYRMGYEVPKPTITLCGFGNALTDADGRYYCHGLAHHQMLHFRWVPARVADEFREEVPPFGAGHLEYCRTKEPTEYAEVLRRRRKWRKVCSAG